jgi:RND family efflux transporter MFP subunit
VSAEIDARVLAIPVDAGAVLAEGDTIAELDPTAAELELRAAQAARERAATLLANEEQRLARIRALHAKGSVSREQLDDAGAHRAALQAELQSAKARLGIAEDQRDKATVRAPIAGRVERRLASVGDFVKRGTPLVEIATDDRLRALLPFPESRAAELAAGQTVFLDSPLTPGLRAEGKVTELRPAVGEANRALWVIVALDNPGGWRPEGTVRARVLLATRENAVTVPIATLVRRPGGEVVYVLEGSRVSEQVVETGERLDGRVEIRAGLSGEETLALEGAAFLSDDAPVRVAGKTP